MCEESIERNGCCICAPGAGWFFFYTFELVSGLTTCRLLFVAALFALVVVERQFGSLRTLGTLFARTIVVATTAGGGVFVRRRRGRRLVLRSCGVGVAVGVVALLGRRVRCCRR